MHRRSALGLLLVAIWVLAVGCNGGPLKVMAELSEANRLAANLRIQLNKASDASNRAVMAETDEASLAFARESKQSTANIERDVAALAPLLEQLSLSNEADLLRQFEQRFNEYRQVDREILALAVENTNLKAQSLSFGPAREAADRFKAGLAAPAAGLKASEQCRAEALIASAVLSVRELQTMQAPHIASADDAAMSGMEKDMASLEGTVAAALQALSGLVEPAALSAAESAFEQFKGVNARIVVLSRQNSNVRSLDLSLRVKPGLASACDDALRTLQQTLGKEGSKATR